MNNLLNFQHALFGLGVLTSLAISPLRSHAEPIVAVTNTNQLISFDSATPGTLDSSVSISGLALGEVILGLDYRPATGDLLALANSNRLYNLDATTGVATQVGPDGVFSLSGVNFGFDFNPLVDRTRVVSDTEQNLRLNPNDGSLTATDTNLAYAVGDVNTAANPNIVGSAYSNNFAGTTSTVLFGIDSNLDILVDQTPANSGILNTIGSLGVDTSNLVGFDISTANPVSPTNAAYAVMNVGANYNLYGINLTTGAASLIGAVGNGTTSIQSLAVITCNSNVSINDVIIYEGDLGTQDVLFTASLARDCGRTVTVDYNTNSGTATAEEDFLSEVGTLVFDPNEMYQTVFVTVAGDTTSEADETFSVNLSNAVQAKIEDNIGVGTILNDDLPVVISTDISIDKNANRRVKVGSKLIYSFTASNLGTINATNVMLRDEMPRGTRFLRLRSSQGNCITPSRNRNGTIECNLGTLAPGASATLILKVKVNGRPKRNLENTAIVESTTADSDLSNNSDTVITRVKTGDDDRND